MRLHKLGEPENKRDWVRIKIWYPIRRFFIHHTVDRYYSIKWYLRNLRTFHEVLKHHRSFDHSSFFIFLEAYTSDLMLAHEKYSLCVNTDSEVKNMKIVRELAKRLGNDDYGMEKFDYSGDIAYDEDEVDEKYPNARTLIMPDPVPLHDFPRSTKHFYAQKIDYQDIKLLCKILERHVRSWWY